MLSSVEVPQAARTVALQTKLPVVAHQADEGHTEDQSQANSSRHAEATPEIKHMPLATNATRRTLATRLNRRPSLIASALKASARAR